jgi:glycerate kinase
MKYLIAFDKFKGALDAATACGIAAKAVKERDPEAAIESIPLTDGGEGFAGILAAALGGTVHEPEVPGPLFNPVRGRLALIPAANIPEAAWTRLRLPPEIRSGTIGVIEMASASGYEQLTEAERNPWETSTYGTGVLMLKAVESGASALLVGIGGSATNDCGAGALEALGVCYYDRELQPVTRVRPATFRQINTLGSTSHLLDAFPPVRIACDVTNPLLGAEGATRIYGPQKGLREEDTDRMERNMQKMGTRILGLFGKNPAEYESLLAEPGSGAAGGIGFALRHALPDSGFVEGFPLVADLQQLPVKVREADCVLTGEGRLDASSLTGKGPVALVRLAGANRRVLLLAGSVEEGVGERLRAAHPGLEIRRISDPGWPLERALRETPGALQRTLRDSL